MLSLEPRFDQFKVTLPKDFLADEIREKYSKILIEKNSFITDPLVLINESIQECDFLGVRNATKEQQQIGFGIVETTPGMNKENSLGYINKKYAKDNMPYSASNVIYRNAINPISLFEKTLKLTFRHSLGFLNYFILLENLLYTYKRNISEVDAHNTIICEMLSPTGSILSKVQMNNCVVDTIDALQLSYKKPTPEDSTFSILYKFSNISYEFLGNLE